MRQVARYVWYKDGRVSAGQHPAQYPPRCTKSKRPPIIGWCTNRHVVALHLHVQFHLPTPSLENARFQWLVHQSGTLCQQTFGTLQTSLNSSVISRPTFLASILILSHAFVFICFSGFRLYIELCNTPVDSFCNQRTLSNFTIVLYCNRKWKC